MALIRKHHALQFASLLTIAACSAPTHDEIERSEPTAHVQSAVERAFAHNEHVRVIIQLKEEPVSAPSSTALLSTQRELLDAIGDSFQAIHQYKSIPMVAGVLSRTGLEQLRKHPRVKAVQIDGQGSGGLFQAVPATGADEVQAVKGLTGKGIRVAVLDTGVSTTHPALQGAVVAEHCFTSNACAPNDVREIEDSRAVARHSLRRFHSYACAARS